MRVKELLQLIPEEQLEVFGVETKVDHQVKKLSGHIMFQLILFSMINRKRISLRVMEGFLKSSSFRALSNHPEIDGKFNSLSDRIALIRPEYFEKIYYYVYDTFSKYLNEKDSIHRYDSTMVAVSSKLFTEGMRVGRTAGKDKKQFKFTFGLHGSLPSYMEVFKDQIHLSEDITLNKAILEDKKNRNHIVVFDRGLRAKKAFEKYSIEEIVFVTRASTNISHDKIQSKPLQAKPANATVTISEDLVIKLKYDRPVPKNRGDFRLIKATIDQTGEEIFFLSNSQELSAYEIAMIYKSRWEIEIFFKFLKQELNIEHLVSRDPNGIRVMMYMTLITSILIIAFRKLNKLTSYKIAKLRFALELENSVIAQIVLLCGGDLSKFNELFDP